MPIFDTLFVMARRLKKGQSMFQGSPDHFAIILKGRFGSVKRTAVTAYIANGFTSLLGFAFILVPSPWHLAVLGVYGAAALAVAGILIGMQRKA